jgi:membrane AbrB-like protein
MPAPFLTGPAICVSVAGLLGMRCAVPTQLRDSIFLIIGIALGSSVTPEVLHAAAAWPVSLIGMCLSVAAIMLAGGAMFQRFFAMDRATAFLSSSPGHLSYVLGFSTDVGANTAIISVIQSIRVLILTLLVPVSVSLLTDADMGMRAPQGLLITPLHLILLAALAAAVGMVFLRVKLPAAFLLAGMIVSTLGHATSLTPGNVPSLLSTAAFVTMGTLIGTRFSGVTSHMLRQAALGGVAFTVLALLVAVLFAFGISATTNLHLIDVIIAIAPGGLETMVAMAAIVDADPAYVAIHHVGRLFFLSAFVPLVLTWKK